MLKKNGLTGREEITDVEIDNYEEGLYQGQESKSLPSQPLKRHGFFLLG